MINNSFTERVNLAANAAIVQQAAAARLLLASQNLAACREENNPYLPGRNPFGVPARLMWAADPCAEQEKELAGATVAHADAVAAAQVSNAPTAQDLPSAPAPQLSDSWDIAATNPVIPESEFVTPDPHLQNMWSPLSILDVMEMIAMELENQGESTSSSEIEEEMELIYENMRAFQSWWAWEKPKRKRRRYQFKPKNEDWIGRWMP
ncbi:NP [Psittacara leucophthalmus chapparvovirus]|uniref:NP n=1 Tax=Psittacara leucophthalmus chapparvovirus TaxID=2604335 RepID=A0A5C0PVS0_9VIRU|nr:NP [Psittacara leucophthalmus chapparvovirus]QEJ80806.1 NP [Psittacara leucophthalmus chapparvovirus]